MNREILTNPLELEKFWNEFLHVIDYFQSKGVENCELLFGFAWGIEYYPSNEWLPENVLLSEIRDKVLSVERGGLGKLGRDDLYIELCNVEFRFCNDSDIHLNFAEATEFSEYFYTRWEQLGYAPAEWLRAGKGVPSTLVRGGPQNA